MGIAEAKRSCWRAKDRLSQCVIKSKCYDEKQDISECISAAECFLERKNWVKCKLEAGNPRYRLRGNPHDRVSLDQRKLEMREERIKQRMAEEHGNIDLKTTGNV